MKYFSECSFFLDYVQLLQNIVINAVFSAALPYLLKFLFLPPANEVCEGYVFTGVCLSTGGVCSIAAGKHIPLGRYPPARHPPGSACWDTVKKRAVSIPLECILVFVYILTCPRTVRKQLQRAIKQKLSAPDLLHRTLQLDVTLKISYLAFYSTTPRQA